MGWMVRLYPIEAGGARAVRKMSRQAARCFLGLLLCCGMLAGMGVAQSPATSQADRIAALEKSAAQNAATIARAQSAGDNAWMLTSAALVLMMSGP